MYAVRACVLNIKSVYDRVWMLAFLLACVRACVCVCMLARRPCRNLRQETFTKLALSVVCG